VAKKHPDETALISQAVILPRRLKQKNLPAEEVFYDRLMAKNYNFFSNAVILS
jgi:hypothetical protein